MNMMLVILSLITIFTSFVAMVWKIKGGESIGGWDLPEPRTLRSYKRLPNGMDRTKALGNAVDPLVPELIGRAIIETEKEMAA